MHSGFAQGCSLTKRSGECMHGLHACTWGWQQQRSVHRKGLSSVLGMERRSKGFQCQARKRLSWSCSMSYLTACALFSLAASWRQQRSHQTVRCGDPLLGISWTLSPFSRLFWWEGQKVWLLCCWQILHWEIRSWGEEAGVRAGGRMMLPLLSLHRQPSVPVAQHGNTLFGLHGSATRKWGRGESAYCSCCSLFLFLVIFIL